MFLPEGSSGEQATIVDLTEQNQGQDQVAPHRTRPTQQIVTYTCPIQQIVKYYCSIQQILT